MAITAEQLGRWRGDVCEWAESNIYLRNPATSTVEPLQLGDHQRAWLMEATRRDDRGHFVNKTCVASWPKRESKSTTVALVAAWRMTCFDGQRIGILANSERQAQSNIFDAIAGFFRDSPNLQGIADIQTRRILVSSLGNVAESFPANWRTVQGTAFSLLCSDELHAADDGGKAYSFASQQTEAVDAQVLVASQAGAPHQSNPVWRLYKSAERGEPGIFFDYRTTLTFAWVKARAEIAKAELLPGEYDYLWGNAWGATGIKLLPAALVESAVAAYREPQTREEWEALRSAWGGTCTIGAGLDRAGVSRKGDRTVWTVVARVDRPDEQPLFHVLRCAVLPTGAEGEVLDEARRTSSIFGNPQRIIFESYGCSDIVEKVARAELAAPTSQRQQTLFNRLYRLFNEGRIMFPEEAGVERTDHGAMPGLLKRELLGFEYDAEKASNSSGTVTRFGTQAGHDDTCYSLAWAVEAADSDPDEEYYEIVSLEDVYPGLLHEYEVLMQRCGLGAAKL